MSKSRSSNVQERKQTKLLLIEGCKPSDKWINNIKVSFKWCHLWCPPIRTPIKFIAQQLVCHKVKCPPEKKKCQIQDCTLQRVPSCGAEGFSLLLRSEGTQFGQSCWTVDLNHRPDALELKWHMSVQVFSPDNFISTFLSWIWQPRTLYSVCCAFNSAISVFILRFVLF